MAKPKDESKREKPEQDKAETKASSKKEKREASADKPEGVKAKAPKGKKEGAKTPARPRLLERTFFPKPGQFPMQWKLVDAAGLPLGRVSSYVAQILMGKLNPAYCRGTNTGDTVVVVNAEKIILTGKKMDTKVYQYHTGYPGGIKTHAAKDVIQKNPDRLIKNAVYGMLTRGHGHMARQWYKNLHVYAGPNHPHQAQKPQPVKLPSLGHGNWERT